MYYMHTIIEFDSDFSFDGRTERTLKDSFYAKNKIDAVKKASKIFALETQNLTHVYTPLGLKVQDSHQKFIDLENLTELEKKEVRDYLKPIIDSLELK